MAVVRPGRVWGDEEGDVRNKAGEPVSDCLKPPLLQWTGVKPSNNFSAMGNSNAPSCRFGGPKDSLRFLWTQPDSQVPTVECPVVPSFSYVQGSFVNKGTHAVHHTFVTHLLCAYYYAKYWRHNKSTENPLFNIGEEQGVNER